MAWYKEGTASIVNGQTSVSGVGTKWASNARVGDAFRAPDGFWYEVVNIASETTLGIFPAYQGATVSASPSYVIAPMQGYVKDSADRLRAAVISMESSATSSAAAAAAAKTSETNAKTSETNAAGSASTATAAANNAAGSNSSAVQSAASAQQYATNAKTSETNAKTSETNAKTSETNAKTSETNAASTLNAAAKKGANSDITSLSGLTTPLTVGQGGTGSQTAAGARQNLGLPLITSLTDNTLGNVLTAGYAGMGSKNDLRGTVFETGTPTDLFSRGMIVGFARGGTDGLVIPGLGATIYGALICNGQWSDVSGASSINQLFIHSGGMYKRFPASATTWGPWLKVYDQNNIIGPVTQSGGVPTGAIIETGSNANGRYTKYADGTLIVWSESAATTPSYAIGSFNAYTATFPVTFVNGNFFCIASTVPLGNNDQYGAVASYPASSGAMGVTIRNGAATAQTFNVRYFAIGRWY